MYKCGSCGKEYAEPFQKCGACGAMKKDDAGTDEDADNDQDKEHNGYGEYTLKIHIDDSDIQRLEKLLSPFNKEIDKDGTTRATQAEMDAVNRKYKDEGEKKKDEITAQGFVAVEAPREPVSQTHVPNPDLVYKRMLQDQILKNCLI